VHPNLAGLGAACGNFWQAMREALEIYMVSAQRVEKPAHVPSFQDPAHQAFERERARGSNL
jgi:hypothetical protein